MDEDDRFAALSGKLDAFLEKINKLAGNETASKVKSPACTIAERDASKVEVKVALDELVLDVQLMANADPKNAVTIINAAGMNVKKSSFRPKQGYSAKDGTESGEVILTAPGNGPRAWRRSTDGVNWFNLDPTSGSETVAKGMTPGLEYSFQTRRILTKGKQEEWSQSIKIRVR
jgi:hypothetical protein